MPEQREKFFTKDIKISLIIIAIPVILIIMFFNAVADHGRDGYDNHPSIYDDDWQRDMYGGTEHYP